MFAFSLIFFLAMVFFYSFSFRSDQRRIFVNEAFDNSAMDNAGEAWEWVNFVWYV